MNAHAEAFPDASKALTAAFVVPIANVLPEAGMPVSVIAPGALSVAAGENDTSAPAALMNSTVMGIGQLIRVAPCPPRSTSARRRLGYPTDPSRST